MPVILAFTLLGASAPIVGAQATSSPDSEAVLQQLVTDFNMNDHAAILSMFTDNAIVSGGPCNNEAQGNECIGRAQIGKSVNENSGPLNVSLKDVQVVGNGNVVTFRTYEVFPLPPQAQAAGIERMVETGTAVIQDGNVDRLA